VGVSGRGHVQIEFYTLVEKMITMYVSSASILVLINGNLTDEFKLKWRLQEDDLFSLFLFLSDVLKG
jgi:hypothetical protein